AVRYERSTDIASSIRCESTGSLSAHATGGYDKWGIEKFKFQYKQTIIFLAYVSVPLPSNPNKIILPEAKQSGCEIENV
ncbi:hypothetical protein, partial [Klebsiella pneumoniae]|uniref:hypothetical protein n=1 Tax=Klebsiella pneumoniae TaxID=573 RepID=UPI001A7E71F5